MRPRTAERAPTPAGARLPALDGLRGLAVLGVVCTHFTQLVPATWPQLLVVRTLGAGWMGVDLFFVLSGFLITGILLDAKGRLGREGGAWRGYFAPFYWRRSVRIFPLYYATLAVLVFLVPLAGAGAHEATAGLVRGQWWFWTYLQNWYLTRPGHLEATVIASHFWSLAVEEQFYLVWPLAVLLVPTRWMPALCVLLLAAAPALRTGAVLAGAAPWTAYALMPMRADALAAGALVAVLARDAAGRAFVVRHAGWVARWALVAAVPVLVVSAGEPLGPLVQTVGLSALALLFAAVVGHAALAPDRPLARVLARRAWLRRLGLYSYGVYVFHMPLRPLLSPVGDEMIRVAERLDVPLVGLAAYLVVAVAAVAALAAVSWHAFEAPLLARGRRGASAAPTIAGPAVELPAMARLRA